MSGTWELRPHVNRPLSVEQVRYLELNNFRVFEIELLFGVNVG